MKQPLARNWCALEAIKIIEKPRHAVAFLLAARPLARNRNLLTEINAPSKRDDPFALMRQADQAW